MDEFPEFDIRVIESLRQPLEDRVVTISRARSTVIFPSDFILIGSMNPCPCGNADSKIKECVCGVKTIHRYQKKVSGPIADRIDLWVEVGQVDYEKLGKVQEVESTDSVKKRVIKARQIQKKRFSEHKEHILLNSRMDPASILSFCDLRESARILLDISAKKLGLSARMYHRIIKIARTIADLEETTGIEEKHILEAIQYRPKLKSLQN